MASANTNETATNGPTLTIGESAFHHLFIPFGIGIDGEYVTRDEYEGVDVETLVEECEAYTRQQRLENGLAEVAPAHRGEDEELEVTPTRHFLTKNGEKITDAAGNPIPLSEFGGIIKLDAYGLTVNENGFVEDQSGNPVTEQFEEPPTSKEAVVPFKKKDGKMAGIVRDFFPSLVDFARADTKDPDK